MTTVTQDGSRTVEETEERNPGSPSEPLESFSGASHRAQERPRSYVSKRHVFKPDGNGRLVLVRKQSEQSPATDRRQQESQCAPVHATGHRRK